jgi:hypothetical protein
MARNWIEFDESSDRHTTGLLYASLNAKRQILVNRYTYDEMKQPEAVKLFFEVATDCIGLKPASPLMPNAFPLRKNGKSGHHIIFAGRFAKKHDLRVDHTVGFHSAKIEDEILVLSLRNTAITRRGHNRRRKRRL